MTSQRDAIPSRLRPRTCFWVFWASRGEGKGVRTVGRLHPGQAGERLLKQRPSSARKGSGDRRDAPAPSSTRRRFAGSTMTKTSPRSRRRISTMIPARPNRRGFLPMSVTGVNCYPCHKTRRRRDHLQAIPPTTQPGQQGRYKAERLSCSGKFSEVNRLPIRQPVLVGRPLRKRSCRTHRLKSTAAGADCHSFIDTNEKSAGETWTPCLVSCKEVDAKFGQEFHGDIVFSAGSARPTHLRGQLIPNANTKIETCFLS